jgi:hypothetical protein
MEFLFLLTNFDNVAIWIYDVACFIVFEACKHIENRNEYIDAINTPSFKYVIVIMAPISEIKQGLLDKNVMIRIPKDAVIYRGAKFTVDLTKTYNINGSTWFTTDRDHDFICSNGNKRFIYTIGEQLSLYGLINLQHPIVRDLLNRAIDSFSDNEVDDIVNFATHHKLIKKDTAEINATNIKGILKSVYGGISMQNQMKLMDTAIFNSRLKRTSSLFNIMKTNLKNSGFRYSHQIYDPLLLHIIVKVLPQKYPIFVGIIGWFHDPWYTPWHDKEKTIIHVFKQEIAMIIPTSVTDPFANISFEDVNLDNECLNTNPQPGHVQPGGTHTRSIKKKHGTRKK